MADSRLKEEKDLVQAALDEAEQELLDYKKQLAEAKRKQAETKKQQAEAKEELAKESAHQAGQEANCTQCQIAQKITNTEHQCVYLKKIQSDYNQIEDEDILSDPINNINLVINTQSTLESFQNAPENGFLSSLVVTAQAVPLIRTAVNGALTLIDIYQNLTKTQSATSTAVKVGTAILGLGLTIASLACPPVGFVLGLVAMGIGLFGDGYSCFEAKENAKAEGLKLAEYQYEYAHSPEGSKRKELFKTLINRQQERFEEACAAKKDANNNLKMSVVAIIGGIFLVTPPLTFIGAAILTTMLVIAIAPKVKTFFSWVAEKLTKKKEVVEPKAVENTGEVQPQTRPLLSPSLKVDVPVVVESKRAQQASTLSPRPLLVGESKSTSQIVQKLRRQPICKSMSRNVNRIVAKTNLAIADTSRDIASKLPDMTSAAPVIAGAAQLPSPSEVRQEISPVAGPQPGLGQA